MAFTRPLTRVCGRLCLNPTPIRGPRAGINCTKTCQKILGRTNTFTVIPVRKTQAATICIPQGPIGKQTQRTTIGASEARPEVDLALLFGWWQLGAWAIWR